MNRQQETQLERVILRLVDAVSDIGSSLPKIKLVKLLYLVDLEAWRRRGLIVTGLDWLFYHYGPYAPALEPVLDRAEGVYFERLELGRSDVDRIVARSTQLAGEAVPRESEVIYLYKPLHGLPEEPIDDPFLASIVESVAARWAGADTQSILDFVYDTGPIRDGRRYSPIDWNLAERNVGLYENRARHFALPRDARQAAEAAWLRWEETGTDRWTSCEAPDWLFDEVWVAALRRMDEDEALPSMPSVRVVGVLPRARNHDEAGGRSRRLRRSKPSSCRSVRVTKAPGVAQPLASKQACRHPLTPPARAPPHAAHRVLREALRRQGTAAEVHARAYFAALSRRNTST